MRANRLRGICCLLCVLFILSILPMEAKAEEYVDPSGVTHVFRWNWTYINANGDVRKCRVKTSDEKLTSLNSYYTNAVNHWNTLDSQFNYYKDKVYIYEVPFAQSKLDFYTATQSSMSWFYSGCYVNVVAAAFLKNGNNNWLTNPDTGEDGTFTSGDITYARIYIKPTMLSGATTNEKYYTFRHEIGHVLGMGHVSTGSSNSLMWPYYQNVYKVCLHDIDVLEGFYPNP